MPQIATNLQENAYYTSQRPFTNQANLISRYYVGTNSVWETTPDVRLTEDANGYPTGFSAPVVCNARIDMFTGHPNGTWNVEWDGPDNAVTIDGGTNGATSCTFTKSTAEQVFLVRIRAPITDLRIWKDGEDINQTFTDEFLSKCRKYRALRFMDWAVCNYAWTPTWATRRTRDSFTQSRVAYGGVTSGEMSWEYCVDLCNQTSSDMWVCVHYLADSSYATSLAQYIHANLNPNLRVYVEHGNEDWNGGFPQRNHSIANGDPGISDPTLRGFVYHADKTAELGNIFKANMIGRTVISCFGVQSATPGFWDFADSNISAPTLAGIDAFSPAPYFGGTIVNTDAKRDAVLAGGVNEAFTRIRAELDDLATGPYWQMTEWKNRADSVGKQLIAYEGGQHVTARIVDQNNTTLTNILIAVNRDVRMYDLYREYLDEWDTRSGGQLMFHFNETYTPSKYGSWGAEEYEGQGTTTAHKWRAILDFINPPSTTDTFFHKVLDYPSVWEPNAVYSRERNGQFELIITDEGGQPVAANRGAVYVDLYATPGRYTWNKRPGAKQVRVIACGAGGGGGSGRKGAAGTNRYGGGGGCGGSFAVCEFDADTIPSSGDVFVPPGGTGGATVSANSTNGAGGVNGQPAVFCFLTSLPIGTGDSYSADPDTVFVAVGGSAGQGGTTVSGFAGATTVGFPPLSGWTTGTPGGAGQNASGSSSTSSGFAPPGGGGGAGINASNVAGTAGGNGGGTGFLSGSGPLELLAGGLGGAAGSPGANGMNSTSPLLPGSGGGGGSPGFAGGNGGRYGAGGGGGGAGTDDVSNSGKGGDGGSGFVMVVTYL